MFWEVRWICAGCIRDIAFDAFLRAFRLFFGVAGDHKLMNGSLCVQPECQKDGHKRRSVSTALNFQCRLSSRHVRRGDVEVQLRHC